MGNSIGFVLQKFSFLVSTPRVGMHRIGRSASLEVEPALLQRITPPKEAERPTARYDAEHCNEGV
jgi:hypothetical protein